MNFVYHSTLGLRVIKKKRRTLLSESLAKALPRHPLEEHCLMPLPVGCETHSMSVAVSVSVAVVVGTLLRERLAKALPRHPLEEHCLMLLPSASNRAV